MVLLYYVQQYEINYYHEVFHCNLKISYLCVCPPLDPAIIQKNIIFHGFGLRRIFFICFSLKRNMYRIKYTS